MFNVVTFTVNQLIHFFELSEKLKVMNANASIGTHDSISLNDVK